MSNALSGAEQGDWLPWERRELFCEELCGRNGEERRGEERQRQPAGAALNGGRWKWAEPEVDRGPKVARDPDLL